MKTSRWIALVAILAPFAVGVGVACKTEPKAKLEAPGQVGPCVIPSTWQQSTWVFDTGDVSGCANDDNRTCASATCTSGDGPCKTYGSLSTRWGTYSPRIQQNVAIRQMSPMAATDPIYLNPLVEGPYTVTWTCDIGVAQQVWTQAAGTVTAKNQNTPQLLASVITPSDPAIYQYVVNSGPGGAGRAFVSFDQSGTIWNFTQPVTGCTTPATSCAPIENNVWAIGDTLTAYNLQASYFIQVLPTQTLSISQNLAKPAVIVQGCAIGSSPDVQGLQVNQFSQWVDDVIYDTTQDGVAQGGTAPIGPQTGSATQGVGFVNVAFAGTPQGLAGGSFYAGMIGSTGFGYPTLIAPTIAGGIEVFQDLVVTGTQAQQFHRGFSFNDDYFKLGLDMYAAFSVLSGPIWGPGTLWVDGNSMLQYPGTAGAGAANFLMKGSMNLGCAGGACAVACNATALLDAGTPTITCGLALSGAQLDLAVVDGGYGGRAFQLLGGGVITNLNQ